jgi:hypothetical protein
MASPDSIGFWSKLGFSRDTELPAEAWESLCDPFDDSVVLQLDAAVQQSCCTRPGRRTDTDAEPSEEGVPSHSLASPE